MARIITGVDFITISTKDFDKARDFYANVLGLEESKRWGSMPAQEFETGNLTIAVMTPSGWSTAPTAARSSSTWTTSRTRRPSSSRGA